MASQPLPQIDQQLCNGCGRCIVACPTHALAWAAGKAFLHQPEQCSYCLTCEDVCPTQAISIPFEIVFGEKQISLNAAQ